MRQAGLLLIGGMALAIAGCATDDDTTEVAAGADGGAIVSTIGPPMLTADLRDAEGRSRARATVEQSGDSLRVRIEAMGMTAGSYGAHIHTTGRCDPPAFTTAGPHWKDRKSTRLNSSHSS